MYKQTISRTLSYPFPVDYIWPSLPNLENVFIHDVAFPSFPYDSNTMGFVVAETTQTYFYVFLQCLNVAYKLCNQQKGQMHLSWDMLYIPLSSFAHLHYDVPVSSFGSVPVSTSP